MSKAELTQKTKDEICKAVKFCSGSFPIDSDSIEPYVYRILDIWEQYAEQESREVNKLLKIAKCPNCDGSGAIGRYVLDGNGDTDVDWEQCQWCYERDLLFNQQEERQ